MSNLSLVEFEQLKSLISGRTLSTGEQTITLDILRSKFPNFFSNLGLTEANLKDDKFLIKYLTESHNRNKIIEALKKELSLSSNQLVELIEALETKPVVAEEAVGGEASEQGVSAEQEVPVGTTTGASTGGMPGMPSGPSISPARRRIYRIPRTEPPKPEIHIANKSGYVTEPGDASKLVRATQSGKIVEAGEPSKLVTTSGGVVKETPPSKIFITDSSGAVTEHPIMPASAAKLPSGKREKKRWFGRLRSGGFSNPLDLLSKRLANWLYQNAIKPLAQWLGRNVLQPLARLAAQTVGRVLLPLVQRLALSALQGLLSVLGGIGGLSGIAFAVGSAFFWGVTAVVAFVAVTILATFLSPFITPIKEPVQVNYTLPLRNPNVSPHPQPIQDIITQTWPDAKLIDNGTDNWQKIIDAAVVSNWNPALLLTLWIEASGAQGKTDYRDPLGCDPSSKPPKDNLDLSLQCFFVKFEGYKDNGFPDFIKAYAESNTAMTGDYQGYDSYFNEDFLQRIKSWYSQMVLEEELGAIKPITQGEASGISGCPVTGIITNPYGYNLPDYPYKNMGCGSFDNCHNGIDIDATIGTDIKAPMEGFTVRGQNDQQGMYIEIHESSQAGTSETIIIFDHLSEYAAKFYLPSPNDNVEKGEIIGKIGDGGESTGPHLHYNIKKGNIPQNPFIYLLGSASINSDVLTSDASISKNNYAEIRQQPGSITNNWGTCDILPSP